MTTVEQQAQKILKFPYLDVNMHQQKGFRMPINFTFSRHTVNGHLKHDPA